MTEKKQAGDQHSAVEKTLRNLAHFKNDMDGTSIVANREMFSLYMYALAMTRLNILMDTGELYPLPQGLVDYLETDFTNHRE